MPESFLPSPGLYLVATPIGNLRDITLRSLDVLRASDIIYCEDTRQTRKLLKAYEFDIPLKPYHDHSSDKDREHIIKDIKQGKIVSLVSDAGTPMICDPGYKLVQSVIQENLPITVIPGANAAISALQLSGLPCDIFMFCGFFPRKEKQAKEVLESFSTLDATLVFYETAPRIQKTLGYVADTFGTCDISIARELTKKFEEVLRGSPEDLIKILEERPIKGEIVLCVRKYQTAQKFSSEDIKSLLIEELKTSRTKDASRKIAELTGCPSQEIYQMAIDLKNER